MKKTLLYTFIVSHIWDTASGTDKLVLLNTLYFKPRDSLSPFEKRLVDVIESRIIEKKGIYIQDGSEFKLYVLEDGAWKKGEKTDNDEFTPHLIKLISGMIKNLSAIYGFIIPFKDTDELIFKTKITEQKRQAELDAIKPVKKTQLKR